MKTWTLSRRAFKFNLKSLEIEIANQIHVIETRDEFQLEVTMNYFSAVFRSEAYLTYHGYTGKDHLR